MGQKQEAAHSSLPLRHPQTLHEGQQPGCGNSSGKMAESGSSCADILWHFCNIYLSTFQCRSSCQVICPIVMMMIMMMVTIAVIVGICVVVHPVQ